MIALFVLRFDNLRNREFFQFCFVEVKYCKKLIEWNNLRKLILWDLGNIVISWMFIIFIIKMMLYVVVALWNFVDDKAKYAAWSARDDIKAEFKVNIILKLADYHYPPVTVDEVYKEVLAQAINFRKFAE